MTKYCPEGDGAFDDWVTSCPECGSTLTDNVPDDAFMRQAYDSGPPVHLQTVPNEIEAGMLSSILRDASIPVLVRPGGPGLGAWASAATFEHAVYVRESDLDRAREVLSEIEVVDDLEDFEEYDDPDR